MGEDWDYALHLLAAMLMLLGFCIVVFGPSEKKWTLAGAIVFVVGLLYMIFGGFVEY